MKVELGQHLRTRDNKDVGTIKYLIFDPESSRIKSVLVEKGLFLTHDIEIPLDHLEVAPNAEPRLDMTEGQVKALPHVDMDAYMAAPPLIGHATGYPPGGLLWPMGYPVEPYFSGYVYPINPFMNGSPYRMTMPSIDVEGPDGHQREIDEIKAQRERHEAILSEGDSVVTHDGQHVGNVHRVAFESTSGRPTEFVIDQGLFFTKDVTLPVEMIDHVRSGVIHLNVDLQHFLRRTDKSDTGTV